MQNESIKGSELYRIGYYEFHTHALMRAVHPQTGEIYTKYTPISLSSAVLISVAQNKKDVLLVAESELKQEFFKFMKERLKTQVALKNKIGGTSWKTELLDFSLKVYKDRILVLNEFVDPK